ncbi:MAG: LUD domain-containing protein [Candidatus Caldarchaeum sp.]
MALKDAEKTHQLLIEKTAGILQKKEWRNYLRDALTRTLNARKETINLLIPDFEDFRNSVRSVRERAVENLEDLIERFKLNSEKRGAKVYLAKDALEACKIVYEIAVEKNAKLLTKSKSMTTEEIELNAFLEERGLKIVETDLGEFIIQLAREKPFHLVYPAVHKTSREVAELFSRIAGKPLSSEISDLMNFVRGYLRKMFLTADIGVTGANIGIAETGTVVVETNEGNDRLGSIPPATHIVVMGLEKIVETVDDALKLIIAHPVSSTGQPLTTYVSFISGRNPMAGRTEGRDLHIIVIDNGRKAMRNDPWFREALYCIRCGACMNICPTYSAVGGHVFGYIYTGAIGIPWTAFVHGLDKAAMFSELCISCGLCKEICPAKIDMPMMIAEVKHRIVKQAGQLPVNKIVENYELFYSLASHAPWLSNRLMNSKTVRFLMERFLGVERRRKIPPLAAKTLKRLLKKKPLREGVEKAVLFADFFAQYVRPDIGMKVVALLEEAGYSIVYPKQKTSGYPYVAYGDLDKARKVAEYNVRNLYDSLRDGGVVVSIEPTATYSLKFVYPKLLNSSDESRKVAASTFSATEVLARLVRENKLSVGRVETKRVAIHIPCHERALDSSESVRMLLKLAGYDAFFVETGTCCGMAGSFGMKHGVLGYELSNVVGEPLFELIKKSGCDMVVTTSSVCCIHVEEGAGLPVYHPLEVLTFNSPHKQ